LDAVAELIAGRFARRLGPTKSVGMSQVRLVGAVCWSGGESGLLGELVEGVLVGAGCGVQPGRFGWVGVGELG